MSKNAQQEIASQNECDFLSNQKDTNTIFRLFAMLALIIVFIAGLTVYISTISDTAAYFMPILLIFSAYPVYNLIKLKTKYLHLALIFALLLLSLLASMLIFIPPNAFKHMSVFFVCFLVLSVAVSSSMTVVNVKKFHHRELSGIICIVFLTALSVLLLLFFRNSSAKGFGFQLWKGVTFTISVKNMALTLGGIVFFSVCAILLTAYLFGQKARITTKYITYVATFAALSVIFKIMGNAATVSMAALGPWFKFTLVYIPWIAAGIVVGPVGAMVATGVGDLLGQLLLPSGGPWFWLTGVSNILLPLFPALIYKYVRTNKNLDWLKVLTGMAISSLVCTLGLGTLAMCIIYEIEYLPLLVQRLPQLIVVGINCALIITLLPALRRAESYSLLVKRRA